MNSLYLTVSEIIPAGAGDWQWIEAEGSERPIFDVQVCDFAEVNGITGQKNSIVSKDDSGNFHIHCTDAKLGSKKMLKLSGSSRIVIQHGKAAITLKQFFQFTIIEYLPLHCGDPCEPRKPAAHLFFIADNRRRDIILRQSAKAQTDSLSFRTTTLQQTHVVRVQKNY
jgi:hypothetical protein